MFTTFEKQLSDEQYQVMADTGLEALSNCFTGRYREDLQCRLNTLKNQLNKESPHLFTNQLQLAMYEGNQSRVQSLESQLLAIDKEPAAPLSFWVTLPSEARGIKGYNLTVGLVNSERTGIAHGSTTDISWRADSLEQFTKASIATYFINDDVEFAKAALRAHTEVGIRHQHERFDPSYYQLLKTLAGMPVQLVQNLGISTEADTN